MGAPPSREPSGDGWRRPLMDVGIDRLRLWASDVLSSHGFEIAGLTWRRQGKQADVHGVAAIDAATGETRHFVLKRFRTDQVLNSPDAVREEFEALRAFAGAIPPGSKIQ